jgi:hypothetical protein
MVMSGAAANASGDGRKEKQTQQPGGIDQTPSRLIESSIPTRAYGGAPATSQDHMGKVGGLHMR